jgi:hypothetical protein
VIRPEIVLNQTVGYRAHCASGLWSV